jgi:hypothetical protein
LLSCVQLTISTLGRLWILAVLDPKVSIMCESSFTGLLAATSHDPRVPSRHLPQPNE